MLRSEFIDEIFTFFKCRDEDLKRSYDLAFTVRDPIDWDKLYRISITETETRYLPAPKWFIDKFPRCYKKGIDTYITPDDIEIKLTLNDGTEYELTTYHLNLTLEEVKQKAMKKYGRQFLKLESFEGIVKDTNGKFKKLWQAL